MNYITDDALRAAAIMTVLDKDPDEIIMTDEQIGVGKRKIQFRFDEIEDGIVVSMNRGELRVEPIRYGSTLVRVKRIIIEKNAEAKR